ncbi:uncharacterized protein LOC135497758 [Lineus longissimus]|uniref:uncharacterized protein LOC135497758 n=1 Tax=Lineus longissimus TaxID=88925 RepID=UPI002B4D20FB
MNSSEALTSQDALQGPSPSPCIGQHWTNWTVGLFDTCGPDGALQSIDSKVTSELSPFDVATIDSSELDLFAALPPGGDCTDLAELSSPTDSEGDFFNSSYMEIFTDLSDIMKMADTELTVEPVIQLDATVKEGATVQENTITTSTSKRGRKRKAAAATSATIVTGEDHRYSSKRSMPDYIQASTSVSDLIDIESPAEDEEETISPVDKKKTKYKERRRKNNIASQKSRQTRKKKNSALEQQAEDLEIENVAMRAKISEAEALTKELKELLVTQLAGGKK